MNYTKARKNPTTFLALTSVSISLFDEILPFFTEAHDEYFRWHDVKGKKGCKKAFPHNPVQQPASDGCRTVVFHTCIFEEQPSSELSCGLF